MIIHAPSGLQVGLIGCAGFLIHARLTKDLSNNAPSGLQVGSKGYAKIVHAPSGLQVGLIG